MINNMNEYHQMTTVLNDVLDNWDNYNTPFLPHMVGDTSCLVELEIYYMHGVRVAKLTPINKDKLLITLDYYKNGVVIRYYNIELSLNSITVTNKNVKNVISALTWNHDDELSSNGNSIFANHISLVDEFKKYYNSLLENVEDVYKKSITEITNDTFSFKDV